MDVHEGSGRPTLAHAWQWGCWGLGDGAPGPLGSTPGLPTLGRAWQWGCWGLGDGAPGALVSTHRAAHTQQHPEALLTCHDFGCAYLEHGRLGVCGGCHGTEPLWRFIVRSCVHKAQGLQLWAATLDE